MFATAKTLGCDSSENALKTQKAGLLPVLVSDLLQIVVPDDSVFRLDNFRRSVFGGRWTCTLWDVGDSRS
jgi:hypothetical protein